MKTRFIIDVTMHERAPTEGINPPPGEGFNVDTRGLPPLLRPADDVISMFKRVLDAVRHHKSVVNIVVERENA